MGSMMETVERYKEDFDLFESADEKIEYIFDLGKRHKGLPEDEKSDKTFIEGCASPAWLSKKCIDGKLILQGEGTSEMAKGMMVLLLDIFSNRPADEIVAFDPSYLNRMGIIELLSPVRQQSLEAFLRKVYSYAKECMEQDS